MALILSYILLLCFNCNKGGDFFFFVWTLLQIKLNLNRYYHMCLEATVIGQHMCKAPVKVTKKDESEYP